MIAVPLRHRVGCRVSTVWAMTLQHHELRVQHYGTPIHRDIAPDELTPEKLHFPWPVYFFSSHRQNVALWLQNIKPLSHELGRNNELKCLRLEKHVYNPELSQQMAGPQMISIRVVNIHPFLPFMLHVLLTNKDLQVSLMRIERFDACRLSWRTEDKENKALRQ